MRDRRRALRHPSYLGARISYNERRSTVDCLLRNVSERGAKLVVASPGLLPSEFDVYIARQERNRRARIVWQRGGTEFGVTFVASRPVASVAPLVFARRLEALEAENVALARRVSERGPRD